jgi:hypothetical protein
MQSADGGVEERARKPLTSRAARGYLSPLRSAARGEVYGRCAARGERRGRAKARRGVWPLRGQGERRGPTTGRR